MCPPLLQCSVSHFASRNVDFHHQIEHQAARLDYACLKIHTNMIRLLTGKLSHPRDLGIYAAI